MLKLSCTKVHDIHGINTSHISSTNYGLNNFKVKMFVWNTLFTLCLHSAYTCLINLYRDIVSRNVEIICPNYIVPAMRPKNHENFNPRQQWLICNFSQLFQIRPTAYKNQGLNRVKGIIPTQYQCFAWKIDRKCNWTINQGLTSPPHVLHL